MTDVITDTAAYMLTYMSQMDCFLMSFKIQWAYSNSAWSVTRTIVHKTLAVKNWISAQNVILEERLVDLETVKNFGGQSSVCSNRVF